MRQPPRALRAHPRGERAEALARRRADLPLEPLAERLVGLQRRGALAGQRQRLHRRPRRRFGEGIEREGAVRGAGSVRQPAPARQVPRVRHQRLDRAAAPLRALRGEPVVEVRGVAHAEALEELPLGERRGGGPRAAPGLRRQPVHVQLDRAVAQPHLLALHLDVRLPGGAPQHVHRFPQRVPRGRLRLVRPQQADQMLARAGAPRRAGEIDQQREVLAPQQLGRRLEPVHRDEERPQGADGDHRAVPQCRAVARAAALSARAAKGGSPPRHAVRTAA